jgi:hypothetical protein
MTFAGAYHNKFWGGNFMRKFVSAIAITKSGAALCAGLVFGLSCAVQAGAQNASTVSAAAFAQNPAQYLNRKIQVRDFACYRDESNYHCASGKGLDVVAAQMNAGAAKKKIEEECGAMDGIERTPGCIFDITFTPTSIAKGQGDIVRNGVATTGEIWIVQATGLAAAAHR